jgi:hypothetical protein
MDGHGTSSTLSTRPNTTMTATTSTTAVAPEVKTEDLAAILERLTDSFMHSRRAEDLDLRRTLKQDAPSGVHSNISLGVVT